MPTPDEGGPGRLDGHIGRYRIEALLGKGGMGQVFCAWDEVLRRRVAIKVLRARADVGGATPGVVGRILREARMAARLDHPGVVSIFDFGEHEGAPFIVMEHVSGSSLRAFVGRGDVRPTECLRWLLDVARALSAAHRAGLVHRDIKPENVMVRDDGVVKVLDFGLARRAVDDPSAPPQPPGDAPSVDTIEHGILVGTPAYMAPEQILTGTLDARADQFAWGVMAFELLTGALPWPHREPLRALLLDVVKVEPPPLDAATLGLPAEVAAAVRRALRKDPDERFPSMDALLVSLGGLSPSDAAPVLPAPIARSDAETIGLIDRAADDPALAMTERVGVGETLDRADTLLLEPSVPPKAPEIQPPAPPTPAPQRHAPPRRSRIAAALALVAAVVATWTIARHRAEPKPSPIPSAAPPALTTPPFRPRDVRRVTFDQGCQEYPAFSPDGRELFFDGNVGPDVHLFALDLASGQRRAITSEHGWQWAPAVSPDGRSLAFLRTEGGRMEAHLAPAVAGAPSRMLAKGSLRPSFTPDGRAVWAGDRSAPSRFDVETGVATRTLHPPEGRRVVGVTELADGRVVARFTLTSPALPKGVAVYAPGADADPRWLMDERMEEAFAVTPDGRGVIVARIASSKQSELAMIPLDGGVPAALHGTGARPTVGLALSRAGDRVAWSTCASRGDMVALARHPDGRITTDLLPVASEEDIAPAWVPRSSRMVVVSDRAGELGLWVLDRKGSEPPRRIPVGALQPDLPAVSPDGALVAFRVEGDGLYVVPIDGGAPPRRLTSGAADSSPCFSSDGRAVYFQVPGARPRIDAVPVDGGAIAAVRASVTLPATAISSSAIGFIALDGAGEEGVPTILDTRTGQPRPLSPALMRGRYGQIRLSRDARHAAVIKGESEVIEVNTATGAVVGRYDAGAAALWGMTYMDDELIVVRGLWAGSLWVGDEPFR
jgi:serine/threonine-protein kinase